MKRLAWLKLNPPELLQPTAMVLILANLIPLYGVFFFGWQVFPILLLFWMENVVVGVFNVFRMLFAKPSNVGYWLAKIFMIPFFCLHYGLFTAVHGVFVFGLFGGYFDKGPLFSEETLFQVIRDNQVGWILLALVLSHLTSFAYNYIGKGEYKQAELDDLMEQPYSRVVLLHVTIIIGGFLVMELGSPVLALVILIFLKTFIDIQAHLREHRKYNQPAEEKEPQPG